MLREDRESGPLSQRWFVVAAGLVALLVVLGVVLAVTRSSGHGAPKAAAVPATAPSRSGRAVSSAAGGGPDRCSLAAGAQQVPTAPPASIWTVEGSMLIPSSIASGPQRHVDGFPVCYAHNPTGALFASVAFWAAATAAPPSRVYATLAADTPTRAEAIAGAQGDNERLSDNGQVSLAAFQYASYSPSSASLTLVLQSTSGVLASVSCTMLWQDGDWHYEIPPGDPPASQVQDLDGYVAWSAAS